MPMTETEARKLLALLSDRWDDATITICRNMASNATSEGRYSTAMLAAAARDTERADALAGDYYERSQKILRSRKAVRGERHRCWRPEQVGRGLRPLLVMHGSDSRNCGIQR